MIKFALKMWNSCKYGGINYYVCCLATLFKVLFMDLLFKLYIYFVNSMKNVEKLGKTPLQPYLVYTSYLFTIYNLPTMPLLCFKRPINSEVTKTSNMEDHCFKKEGPFEVFLYQWHVTYPPLIWITTNVFDASIIDTCNITTIFICTCRFHSLLFLEMWHWATLPLYRQWVPVPCW